MNTGIRWLKIVLHLGEQAMITSLLLGVNSPGAHTPKFVFDTDRIAQVRAIDVDRAEAPILDSDDTAGPPILFVEALDLYGTVEASLIPAADLQGPDGEDDLDDEDIDWPLFAHGTSNKAVDQSSHELRLHADDPVLEQLHVQRTHEERMHAAWTRSEQTGSEQMHLGIFGGCASTVKYAELERQRVREPNEAVSFYL